MARSVKAGEQKDGKLETSRREVLLNEAARLFATQGYENTSMRDIASALGILPGSIYYHFPSKKDLLTAVYSIGIEHIVAAVSEAVERHQEPWARLEAACVTHLETLLGKPTYSSAVITNWSDSSNEDHLALIPLRDRYEQIFIALVNALPLPSPSDHRYLRLALLGALNWSLAWYHPGKETPATIAKRFVALFKAGKAAD